MTETLARRVVWGALAASIVFAGDARSASAETSRWSVGLQGTVGVIAIVDTQLAGHIGLQGGFRPWRQLELGLTLRGALRNKTLQLDTFARVLYVFRWRWLTLLPGLGLGYSADRVTFSEQGADPLWTGALLARLQGALAVSLPAQLELRIELVGSSFYFNRFWIYAWEPALALHYRF